MTDREIKHFTEEELDAMDRDEILAIILRSPYPLAQAERRGSKAFLIDCILEYQEEVSGGDD